MSANERRFHAYLKARQQDIQDRCFHPEGGFLAFAREEIEQSIPARFESQVALYPDRLAVSTDHEALTYQELNLAANRVAHAILSELGEGQEPVVLLLDHGAAMYAAILGVLKAGKIYVTLDPSYPLLRNTLVTTDSRARLIVTDSRNQSQADELSRCEQRLLNTDEISSSAPTDSPDLDISPDGIAYIMYTSGSTGMPKGVYQAHRNLLHHVMQYTNQFHYCRHDRFTQLYSFASNGSLRGIFHPLLNGASTHLYDVRTRGLADLATWIEDYQITFYHSVTSLFRYFMDTLDDDVRLPTVRLIRFGGERVPRKNVTLYKKHFADHCILYTSLGATETSSTVRRLFIDKDTEIRSSIVPTGFAVPEKDILLLDDEGRQVEPGAVGEIVVKSSYLARGYWHQPELTQERFRPDPDGSDARLYYTGDLGRMSSNGCLVHRGRKDFQIKIRGYRVEVTEIEAALMEHPAIKEAAVVLHESEAGTQHLVAYIVAQPQQVPTTSELNLALRKRLPDHMIPTAFVVLGEMPLTTAGKTDRRALPEPELSRPDLEHVYVAPSTQVEKVLADIWAQVLGLQQVGIHDSFFDLGGHSLAATQVMARLQDAFRVELPFLTIFERTTIASLAEAVEQAKADDGTIQSPTAIPRANWALQRVKVTSRGSLTVTTNSGEERD